MPNYKVATGHGVALVSLNDMNPQPAGGGVMPVQRNQSASGVVHEIGNWAELKWDMLETETQYVTLLTQFGLHNALTNQVTVYIRNEFFAFARYNAIAVRPEMGRQIVWADYFIRNVSIILKNLTAL